MCYLCGHQEVKITLDLFVERKWPFLSVADLKPAIYYLVKERDLLFSLYERLHNAMVALITFSTE